MTTAKQAQAILRRAVPTIGENMALLVLTIGWLESHWGDGWTNADLFEQPAARESNNWGAITEGSRWIGPTFKGKDSKWTPNGVQVYETRFRAYPTPEAGARDLWAVLGSQYTAAVDAALNGQWDQVSEKLYGYYRGTKPRDQAIADHRERFMAGLRGIRAKLSNGGSSLGVGALAALLLFLLLKGKR